MHWESDLDFVLRSGTYICERERIEGTLSPVLFVPLFPKEENKFWSEFFPPSTFFLQYFEWQDEIFWKIKIEDEETLKQNFYLTTNGYCIHQLVYTTKSILTPLHTPIHNVCVIYTKLVPNF